MTNIDKLKLLKTIGLDETMPLTMNENGELNTNQTIFLLKRCIFELVTEIEQLKLEVAQLPNQIEPE
jgi:hypothetical protein